MGTFGRSPSADHVIVRATVLLGVMLMMTAFIVGATSVPTAVSARDPWYRPFRSDSIWNTPVGAAAQYVDARLPPQPFVLLDRVLLIRADERTPRQRLIRPGSWTNRCSGTSPTGEFLHLPPDLLIPDSRLEADGSWTTPNHVAAFLAPDGRTVINTNAVARCTPGGPIYGYWTNDPSIDRSDLYGDGRLGSHGGSRLSGLGGAIRPGELSGEIEIRHALDVLISAEYMWWGNGDCYRWPAARCDSYASADTYRGSIEALRMGALLALPPGLSPESIGVTSAVGRRLFTALQDYGAYVTDDSAWEAYYLSVDSEAIGTFEWGPTQRHEFNLMMSAIAVVDDNRPEAIGGAGLRRRPPLPELVPPETLPPKRWYDVVVIPETIAVGGFIVFVLLARSLLAAGENPDRRRRRGHR